MHYKFADLFCGCGGMSIGLVNAGFIDGWVIVIGQARHYTGAPYRLRYEEIVSFLHTGEGGYFSR